MVLLHEFDDNVAVVTTTVASITTAMRFLMWALRNVRYVRFGKLIVRLWHLQCLWTVVWGFWWDGCWKTPATAAARLRPLPPLPLLLQTRPAATPTEPQLEQETSAGVILPETGQFLLLCLLQLWQQLQRCLQTRARVSLLFYTFYFRSAETVHCEQQVS